MQSNKSVIYARVSSKEQEREGYSIDAQLKLLRLYAKEKALYVVLEFREAESAKTAGRVKFNEMLKFLQTNPDVKYLLCEKTDRLSRNFKDIAAIDFLIQENGLKILLVKENSEISKESKSHEKFMFGIKALMAKNYSDNLSEEVRKGMNEKADRGFLPGGHVPFGYKFDKESGKIVIDPDRAPIVKDFFTTYATNKVSLAILAATAKEQWICRIGKCGPLSKSQIDSILKNVFYIGQFRWAGKIYEGKHDAIISQSLFNEVQTAFGRHGKPMYRAREFAYGSLMTCGVCGCKITAEIKKGKYIYYRCTGMRGREHVLYIPESHITGQLGSHLAPLALAIDQAQMISEHIRKRSEKSADGATRRITGLTARLTQLRNWKEQSYVDKLEGKISEADWKSFAVKWDGEASSIQCTLDSNQRCFSAVEMSVNRILELSQRLPELWDRRNNEEKRKLVDLLYSNCTLTGRSLCVTYRKPFSYIAEGRKSQDWLGN